MISAAKLRQLTNNPPAAVRTRDFSSIASDLRALHIRRAVHCPRISLWRYHWSDATYRSLSLLRAPADAKKPPQALTVRRCPTGSFSADYVARVCLAAGHSPRGHWTLPLALERVRQRTLVPALQTISGSRKVGYVACGLPAKTATARASNPRRFRPSPKLKKCGGPNQLWPPRPFVTS